MSEPVAWRYYNSKWGEYSYTEHTEDFRCTLEPLYTHPAPTSELVKAAEECRIALEPYDDVKPRDWKTDRERLAAAHKRICAALDKVKL